LRIRERAAEAIERLSAKGLIHSSLDAL